MTCGVVVPSRRTCATGTTQSMPSASLLGASVWYQLTTATPGPPPATQPNKSCPTGRPVSALSTAYGAVQVSPWSRDCCSQTCIGSPLSAEPGVTAETVRAPAAAV